ncbi:hypothetical protein L4D09_19720 [Photobacterium makurazakiensis]|uniref:hypothetical protein n=1 Tax=Photobacterium makurazakiensis TaxID=2910234 RepID=UPI003D0B8D13
MTDKTLRERLPIGSARNKIEYLADELQLGADKLAALEKLLSGEPVVNLIHNGDFVAPAVHPAFNTTATFTPKETVFDKTAFSEAASSAAMFPTGWGGEVIGYDNIYQSSFGVRVDYRGANITNRDYVTIGEPEGVKAAMVFHGLAYKAVALAPFSPQRKTTIDMKYGSRNEYVTVTASVRLGSNCKWGLLELNPSTGEIEDVVFCESFSGYQSNHSILRKDGLILDENKSYALAFYDVQQQWGNGADGLVIGWAAAFFNDEQNPELSPTVWPTGNNDEFHILKTMDHTDIANGVTIDTHRFTGSTNKPTNHAVLRICGLHSSDNNYNGEKSIVTEAQIGNEVTITMADASSLLEYAICAKLTPYPQRVGFFNADGSSAFDTLVEYQSPYAE